jgi:Tfp pilus assembly protein PilF
MKTGKPKTSSLIAREVYFASSLMIVVALSSLAVGPALCKEQDWNKELQKGYSDLSTGNTEQAIEFFRNKVRKNPASGACHTGLGIALRRLGKISDAKAELRQSTEVEPGFADGFLEYGKILEDDKEFENAAQAFEKYLQLKPDSGQRRAISDRITYCRNQKQ